MALLTTITMLALIQYIVFGIQVGGARGKYDVPAPATTGHDLFERHYRIHLNTLEQLVIFIPSLWAFGHFVGHYWAAGLGVIFLVGRIVYARNYLKDPGTRGIGMLLSIIPCYLMTLGALVAALISFI